MKILKSFLSISLLLLAGLRVWACGPGPMVMPDDCDLYRILPYYAELHESDYGIVDRNCKAWKSRYPKVKLVDIRLAIYDYTLADWQKIASGKETKGAFDKALVTARDTDAVRLLLWSKYYEQWSEQMRSPWYYGCGMDDGGLDIDSIAKTAATYRGPYEDRYLLLAIKCLYRSGRNEECAALWKQRSKAFKGSHLVYQAVGYYAACLNRMGRTKEAINIYARIGDAASLQLLQEDKVAVFEQIIRSHPNSPFFPIALQRVLFVVENYSVDDRFRPYALDSVQLIRLCTLAQKAATHPRVKDRAMWGYVAACLLNHQGRQREALAEIESGRWEARKGSFLETSVKMLQFYLHSRLDPVDDRYEQYLLGNLKWVDARMQEEWKTLDNNSRYHLSHTAGQGYNYEQFRTLYANDALRRIVLEQGGVADRLYAAHRATRALQVANMAENRLLQISHNPIVEALRKGATKLYSEFVHSSQNYRDWGGQEILDFDSTGMKHPWGSRWENNHDFSNRLFVRADRMGADVLAAYWQRVEKPRSQADRWLNERGYTRADYWLDIIGTHMLREMRFGEAEKWLARVDSSYQHCLNTEPYMVYDPFAYFAVEKKNRSNYKLRFAQQMAGYEKTAGDGRQTADDRADAMLTMSIGLRNAFDERCWPLVGYGGYTHNEYDWLSESGQTYQEVFGYPDPIYSPWEQPYRLAAQAVKPYAERAHQRAAELRKQAFATYRTPDRKAKGLRRVCEFTYLMAHFAQTPTGQDIARHCDQWKDYRCWHSRIFPSPSRR